MILHYSNDNFQRASFTSLSPLQTEDGEIIYLEDGVNPIEIEVPISAMVLHVSTKTPLLHYTKDQLIHA